MKLFDYEQKHLEYLRQRLADCTVLLQTNGAFPLDAPGRIAAYGSGVRHTVKGGTGSGEVNSRYFINVEQGLTAAGFTITTGPWLDAYDAVRVSAERQFAKDLNAQARANHELVFVTAMGAVMPEPEYDLPLDGDGDAAIYVLSRISGEGNDRKVEGDVKLTATEIRDILALNERFHKFMLVINTGGPVDLSPVAQVGNILVLSQLGVETGSALADILLGKQNPSGKLTTTWTAWEDYPTIGQFGERAEVHYTEGIYVGYRYFDTVGKKARYPFGHGLSYTAFHIAPGKATIEKDTVTLTATVTNTGGHAGREVAQLYVSAPGGKLDKPWQELAAFAKTGLIAPGEQEQVTMTFRLGDLASFDDQRQAYILEQGNYILRLGNSSANTAVAALIALDGEAIIRKVRSCCGAPDHQDWTPARRPADAISADTPVLCIRAAELETLVVDYDKEEPIDPAVEKLSDEELIMLNVGAGVSNGGIAGIVGNSATQVCGAAGESSTAGGFPALVMADGPAGLRLSPRFYRDKKGLHAVDQLGLPESVVILMPKALQWLAGRLGGSTKLPKNAVEEYQYCTAIPIGTALAQSWDLDFARGCGDIVGDEMERFGVHLWLAPALNIHRNIRCGRNFEYFSEDPLISGRFAAALTQGVQAHAGCGVTIKHYAANNQETNRYSSNSQVSQRALREIYLRGFEICVRESRPKTVMTSYNLLNGRHTSERRDLIQDILRREWGFEGVVMTDWIIAAMPGDKASPHPKPDAGKIAAAGSELVMPGDRGNLRDLRRALKNGTLSRRQLQINASRLLRLARELTEAE